MSKEALKEEIKFLTEIFRLLAILTLAVGGSTISLVLGEYTVLKVVFAVIGITASIGSLWRSIVFKAISAT